MPTRPSRPRLFAALIAAAAWLGIVAQMDASLHKTGSIAAALWAMLRYFTIVSNLLVAGLFSVIAARRTDRTSPLLMGGATVMMLLVGIVYQLLLRGLHPLAGSALIADILLHDVTPILVPLYWLLCVPRGRLGWRAPWIWAAVPLLYLLYALLRGAATGIYPYPFLDATRIGWTRVTLNACAIAAAFILVSFLLVAFDRRVQRPGAKGKSSAS